MIKKFSISILACVLMVACASSEKTGTTVTSVDHVDLQKYLGTWFEIGSFPMFFQRQCVAKSQANYTMEADGRIGVHNQCQTNDGIDKANGVAVVVDGSKNAKLKVSFFGPFWADYWVVGLDPNYQWALVGNPNRKYLWLLSRTKTLPKEQLDAALSVARQQGFDLNNFHYTAQR